MSLNIIFGKSGTGKSTYIFNKIKEIINNKEKIYIVTPEQFSFTAEKKLLESTGDGAVINSEVLTFSRMAYRVINENGNKLQNIEEFGKSMLIYNILEKSKSELTFLGKSSQNLDVAERSITEFKKHNISVARLKQISESVEDKYLKAKLADMTYIYEQFENEINEKFLDENDSLTYLAENIKNTKAFNNSIIFIDEFVGFTPQEYKVIEELMKVCKEMYVTVCVDSLEMNDTNEDTDVFFANKLTASKLIQIAELNKIDIAQKIKLDVGYRFKKKGLKFLEENLYAPVYKRYPDDVPEIELFLAKNPYSEIEHVAEEIINNVRDNGYRYKDIGIITKNIDTYSSLIKAIFSKYDIPVYIDEKKDLSDNILIKYIISLLDVFAKNFSYESVVSYIKLKFCGLTEEETYKIENYAKKWGVKYSKWYKEDWKFGEDEEVLTELNDIRKRVMEPLLNFRDKCYTQRTARELSKGIYEFLVENEIDKKLQEKANKMRDYNADLAEEYEDSFHVVIKILDEIVKVFGDEKVSFEKYADFLKISFTENGLGKLPAGFDEVTVGDVDRSRSHTVKAIFIIGLNDGVFPSINNDEGFLNDNDREFLKEMNVELAKTTMEALYNDNFNIYKAFTTAEEKLYMSYISADSDGTGQKPSTILLRLKKIFALKEKSDVIHRKMSISRKEAVFDELLLNIRNFKDSNDIDPVWFGVYKVFEADEEWKDKLKIAMEGLNFSNKPEVINKKNIQRLYGKTLKTSVSRLESYRKCPFSFYLKYGLKVKDRDTFKLENLDTGTFMHDVIDTFFDVIESREIRLEDVTDEIMKKIIDEIIDDKLKLKQNYIFISSAKFRNQTFRLKRLILKAMKYIILSITDSDFEVLGHEIEFGEGKKYPPIEINLEDGKKVEIVGKIDRVDVAKDEEGKYLRIIDYKSSNNFISLNDVAYGLQLQLLTYLDATCKIENAEAAAVLYFNLIEEKIDKRRKPEEIEEDIRKNFKMKGLILAEVKIVKMMDKSLESGYSNVIPVMVKKDGEISEKKSNVASKEQFDALQNHIIRTVKEISKEILSRQY